MLDQRLTDAAAGTEHQIDHALGHAGFLKQFHQLHRAPGREVGRLHHRGATVGERRADLAYRRQDREIPGRDRGDHTHRLAEGHRQAVALLAWQRPAFHAAGLAGGKAQFLHRPADLAARFGQDLALFGRDEEGELLGPLLQQFGGAEQDGAALRAGHLAPRLPGAMRGADGAIRVFRGAFGEVAEDLVAPRGVRDGHGVGAGLLPLPVDVVAVAAADVLAEPGLHVHGSVSLGGVVFTAWRAAAPSCLRASACADSPRRCRTAWLRRPRRAGRPPSCGSRPASR